MADERYQWLDQEAAERLLRGEPVDAVDDHAREQAERLAEALASARFLPLAVPADAELPGEEAALAAFRKATAERSLATSPAVFASDAAELGGVRLGRVPAARQWGRSLRFGLAAAVAAVAVGGVAVASGTGMLPFDDRDRPAPAGSVSAVEIPEPVVSGSSDEGFGTATPSAPPSGEDPTPNASPSLSTPPTTPGAGGTGTSGEHDGTPEPGRTTDRDSLSVKIVKACQDYRAGRLDDSAHRRLTDSVRTGETVRSYCDRVLAGGATGGATREPSTDSSGGKGDGKGDDGSSGEGERAGSPSGTGGKGRDENRGKGRGDHRVNDRGDSRGNHRDDGRNTGRDQRSDRSRDLA
ncbi:hypothetical protein [Streptomyces sp. NBC_01353]|uniref:hypothetical protein n=1 Tax=Streptomyces sp. NBC_01353 TaxID=2903835 RepID=UPI002E318E6C|nr:hypothetical protein [Streptomyces sp. NBC_01353]